MVAIVDQPLAHSTGVAAVVEWPDVAVDQVVNRVAFCGYLVTNPSQLPC